MRKDIEFPRVENVGICATPDITENGPVWRVHILNLLQVTITNVLVSSRGFGVRNDEPVTTSQLRYFYERVEAQSSEAVELIPDELRGLNNEYWLSYYIGPQLFDKKFLFLPETLIESNLSALPILELRGILIL